MPTSDEKMPTQEPCELSQEEIRRRIDEFTISALGMMAYDGACVISQDEARAIAKRKSKPIETIE